MPRVEVTSSVNRTELRRYLTRIADRWQLQAAYLGGAAVADERGAPAQRERGHEFVVVLVSDSFDAIPWLERVYVAGALWDAMEMGAPAEIHCYTPPEFARKCVSLRVVRNAVWEGLDLLEEAPPGKRDL